MCKTGPISNRRPAALVATPGPDSRSLAEQSRPSSTMTATIATTPTFLQQQAFNPMFSLKPFQAGGSHEISQSGFFPRHPSLMAAPSFPVQAMSPQSVWLHQHHHQQQALMNSLARQASSIPGCIDLLTTPSLSNTALPKSLMFDMNLLDRNSAFTNFSKIGVQHAEGMPKQATFYPSQPMTNSITMPSSNGHDVPQSLKRPMPDMIPDSNSEHSSSDVERTGDASKKLRTSKKKHEATLDGERRVAIEFESFGRLGTLPQTYGKGALIVPDGLTGKYSAFGQRWQFTIKHSVGPVICEDGVHRMCLAWSVTNLNSEHTHTVTETPTDAMKRDRDGKTLCNRVFRDALSLRASSLETDLRNTNDPNACVDLQSQLRTIQTKRFSEGPLFFGLRHLSLQNEMKNEMVKRRLALPKTSFPQPPLG